MNRIITPEVVEAYSLCPRKAFLLMQGDKGVPHEYLEIAAEQEAASRSAYRQSDAGNGIATGRSGFAELAVGETLLVDATVHADGVEAPCDALKRVAGTSGLGRFHYEPVKVVGTQHIDKTQIIGLAYRGYVIGEVQKCSPAAGTLIRADGQPCRAKLTGKYRGITGIIATLRSWKEKAAEEVPPVTLNKHCPYCPFRDTCHQIAEKEDNLSLLDRMTPKLMRKYHDQGIFTVRQLSHVYKPRRSRKKARRQVRHSLELQALAIRTGKIHIEHLPELPRGPVELILDLEGVPDTNTHYLAGLLVCRGSETVYESFWADNEKEEAEMWSALVARLEGFPDSAIYHYGSYEKKAFATLAKRHGRGSGLVDRLVNVASFVYGKVYFPVRSNGLKPLGRFLGTTWTDPRASGLQSLVWRHRWKATRDERFKQSLLQYNREDCEAVRLLVDRLDRIRRDAVSDPTIEFASRPKRLATETGKAVHGQFEQILRSAQLAFAGRGIRIREPATEELQDKHESSNRQRHYRRIVPNTRQMVHVEPVQRCPKDNSDLVPNPRRPLRRIAVDLIFTKSGCRKTITKYVSIKSRCPICGEHYGPDVFRGPHPRQFGHTFQAWIVYQRIILRLPYRIIVQVTEHLFGVGMCSFTPANFLRYLADYYAPTEAYLLEAILNSEFVHVDETKISIKGVDHYVWVFTDGKHVVFRMTESREANIVREMLTGYKGVLISDFYPGYDGIPCRQQKCLVHLVRDMNDDLWKSPFDEELEAFAVAVQSLLVPILRAVDRFGLKAWHLRKFLKDVERFYERQIIGREYTSEPARIFQNRFIRYRESLFTFLTQDGIPWENNMAERAIRQLAVQRKISGSFSKQYAGCYLQLLAISQTCRFQDKSFLKFLLSKELDLDSFRRSRPSKYSTPVIRQDPQPKSTREQEDLPN